ncbi:hypothetical protein ACFO3D_13850 [Virgibacillus kekensis]|uniref:Uncharacterized protein n=1 Tax=Virgibacillus kekensis TaxID=202261 RepID=A0ABV9DLN3_9BACI
MKLTSKVLGIAAGIVSITMWVVLNYYNPYANPTGSDPMINTFIMLFLPGCLAIIASVVNQRIYLLIAFLWSLPISFYLVLTTSIFSIFGITCLSYLISFLMMRKST